MENSNLYQDIQARTDGDIYVGVVGPVRTGKSTFIKRFMDLLVIPNIENEYKKERAKDELPQSAGGRTIMTTEPKFVPNEAVQIHLGDNLKFKAENDYAVYFGWNYLKWYEGYDSVDAIVDGLNHLKENNMSYRFARLGESYDDYEEESFESDLEEEQDLDYPSMLREFDDSYVIEEMNRINSVKDYQIDEI